MADQQIDPNTGERVGASMQIDPNTGERISSNTVASKPSFWSDPGGYLRNRASELQAEAQRRVDLAEGIESYKPGFTTQKNPDTGKMESVAQQKPLLERFGHRILSLVPETGAVIDKAAAGLMDPKNAAILAAGAVDPAIPAAYFGTQALSGLTGVGQDGPGSVQRAIQNPTPENVQEPLLQGAQLAGSGVAAGSPKAGTAINPMPVISRTALLGRTPAEAYQSALKPSTTLSEAERNGIIQTGLNDKIPVSQDGLEKLGALIDDANAKIKAVIATDPNRPISTARAVQNIDALRQRSSKQVNPESDVATVDASKAEFLRNNPGDIPAEAAQEMKQGTYRALGNKAYGELKGAAIESQKNLARGLKDEIAEQFPELKNLNAKESEFLNLDPILERAVNRIQNHQLVGIGTPIAAGAAKAVTGSAGIGVVAGVLKAVLDNPAVKSRLAIALNRKGVPVPQAQARIADYATALSQAALSESSQQNAAPQNQSATQ